MFIAMIAQPRDEIVLSGETGASVAIVVREIASRLARQHRVVVYARQGPSQHSQEIGPQGIEVHRVAGGSRSVNKGVEMLKGFVPGTYPHFASTRFFRGFFHRVAADLARLQPDVILLETYAQFAPLFRAACPRARIALHAHDETLAHLDPGSTEASLREVDLVLAVSDQLARSLRERFPRLADRVRTLRNGIDLTHWTPAVAPESPADGGEPGRLEETVMPERPPASSELESLAEGGQPERSAENGTPEHRAEGGEPVILYVGRVSPEKGLHVLADAFASGVLPRVPGARLEIVGPPGLMPYAFVETLSDNPLMAQLSVFYGRNPIDKVRTQLFGARTSYVRALRSRLGPEASSHVQFRGAVPYGKLPAVYRAADLLVHPTVCNEQPVPILEAMACGLPVVASRLGGRELVVDGETGFVVEAGDPSALAAAICRLFGDRELRRSMGVAGRARAERFTWDQSVSVLLGYLDEAP
jgi:glycosyltransferase involved in cell wall biosynthesis